MSAFVVDASSGGGSNTGSPPGTLATQAADFTFISADAVDITSGTTITSTGGNSALLRALQLMVQKSACRTQHW